MRGLILGVAIQADSGQARRMFSIQLRSLAVSCAMICGVLAQSEPVSPAIVRSEFIYPDRRKPTPECHASTIAQLPNGTFIAAWFGGKYEKHSEVGIWTSHYRRGAWTAPVQVATGIQYFEADGNVKRHPCWNPVLHQSKAGPLLLFYKVGPSPSNWWGMLKRSEDWGVTWSEGSRLPEGILGPIKNKPVELPNGDLLCPTSSEDQGWRVHFEWTPDLGKTWHRTAPINDGKTIGAIQPSVLFEPGGKLVALGRSRQGKIWEARSEDNGRTWGEMSLIDLPNPNSGTDAVTMKDGRQVLVFNDTPKGRTPLTVAVKNPGGEWKRVVTLEDQPGEYSYPAVIQSVEGELHITYTWKRLLVRHVIVDPAKF